MLRLLDAVSCTGVLNRGKPNHRHRGGKDEPGEGVRVPAELLGGQRNQRDGPLGDRGYACLTIQLRGVPPIGNGLWGP